MLVSSKTRKGQSREQETSGFVVFLLFITRFPSVSCRLSFLPGADTVQTPEKLDFTGGQTGLPGGIHSRLA